MKEDERRLDNVTERGVPRVTAESVVVEIRNLSKNYRDVKAVDSLNMEVESGEIFGFLGPNGAGKTTTIKMIMGLTHPSAGELYVNGVRVSDESVQIRRQIGYLPERVSFYENLTPLQTLRFFCDLKGVDGSAAETLLEEVGLEGASHRKVGTLSKGMIQLLGFAQAMIGNPSIYIFDEPFIGLDARWLKVAREKITALNEKGATVVFSSHILSEAQSLCDRVAVINKGRLVAEDTVSGLSKLLHMKPRLEVSIAGLKGKVPNYLLKIGGVQAAEAAGDKLIVTCEASARLRVITTLQENGMNIQGFKTFEPTLEEAFVKLLSQDEGAA